MIIPSSTYRVQLHKDFTFQHLENIIDYLYDLGITTIYAAPIFQPTPGSQHGYDVTDPHHINDEIGSLDDLERIARKLKAKGMSWIQDIVPNHMAFNTSNARLMDVLERGAFSEYYQFFDIDWEHPSPALSGKLQVPFLADSLETCVSRGDIKVSFSERGFCIDYLSTLYPLSLQAFQFLFSSTHAFDWQSFLKKGCECRQMNDWKEYKSEYVSLLRADEKLFTEIVELLEDVSNDHDQLIKILQNQFYHLTCWRDTEREINYRRFFTVNELICLRMEEAAVFDEYHTFLHSLYSTGIIQGIRIDHIDGLKDPTQYIFRLRELFGNDCFIIAEKILESKESLPRKWPIQGTSGYEFLAYVNKLLTSNKGSASLRIFYEALLPNMPSYKHLVWANKKFILEKYMSGEWENFSRLFFSWDYASGYDRNRIKVALGAFLMGLQVYRIYPDAFPLQKEERIILIKAFDIATSQEPGYRHELDYLRTLLTAVEVDHNENSTSRLLPYLQRLMQFAGPLTAKGVEDTTFFIYNAFLGHDEVGDSPNTPAINLASFHQRMICRLKNSPMSLNATSTHDTKRGEDARARLSVLCEFSEQWKDLVLLWLKANEPFRQSVNNSVCPSANDEYAIYQAILGGFPENFKITREYIERFLVYQTKVLREAKIHSDWSNPHIEYEDGCKHFIENILNEDSAFLKSFLPFLKKVCDRAHTYTLYQTLVKLTAPGIPDIYQGAELLDLSYVDPDNRRPVDFSLRSNLLNELNQRERTSLFNFLDTNRQMCAHKLFLIWKVLTFRRDNPEIFLLGEYIQLEPLTGAGVIGYARHTEGKWVLIICPMSHDGVPIDEVYEKVILAESFPGKWRNLFTEEIIYSKPELLLSGCLKQLPVALLINV